MPLPVKKKSPKPSPAKPVQKAVGKVLANPFSTEQDLPKVGKFILVYGPPGEGKTTVFAHAPDPLFVYTDDEQGIISAITTKVVPENVKDWLIHLDPLFGTESIPDGGGHPGWNKLMQTMDLFESGEHNRRTLIIDSGSGLEALAQQHCASILFKGNMTGYGDGGFMSFYAGYLKTAEQFWRREFMTRCSRIVSKGYNVIIIAHSMLKEIPNPEGSDFQIFMPSFDRRIWDETKRTVQAIFFMGRSNSVKKVGTKTKVSATNRFIGVSRDTWYEAKNWFNTETPIDVGNTPKETWENLNKILGMV